MYTVFRRVYTELALVRLTTVCYKLQPNPNKFIKAIKSIKFYGFLFYIRLIYL